MSRVTAKHPFQIVTAGEDFRLEIGGVLRATFKRQSDGSYILHDVVEQPVTIDGELQRTGDRGQFEWLWTLAINTGHLASLEQIEQRKRRAH